MNRPHAYLCLEDPDKEAVIDFLASGSRKKKDRRRLCREGDR